MPAKEFDPLKYVEIVMRVKHPRPKVPAHQLTQQQLEQLDQPFDELIPLDPNLTLILIYKLLYPFSGFAQPTQSFNRSGNYTMDLLYRKKIIIEKSLS